MTPPNKKNQNPIQRKDYDVIIVGAGPAALATLSAIQDPYSLDILSDGQAYRAARHLPGSKCRGSSVLVVDPHEDWMEGWKMNFDALDIKFLRSPVMAHPDMFDQHALLTYAMSESRQDELIESGCADLKTLLPLGQSQVGLWKLPSVDLFNDFCQDLARRLPHEFHQGTVVNIKPDQEGVAGSMYDVVLQDGKVVKAAAVVLAMGAVGRPVIPRSLADAPPSRLIPWTQLGLLPRNHSEWKKVLVVGGGLTALQAALKLASVTSAQVTLCSRRPLVERHFDLSLDWFDRRSATKCMSDFYHQCHSDRLALLKQSRGGGSIPGIYMQDLRKLEAEGCITRVVGSAEVIEGNDDDGVVKVVLRCVDGLNSHHQEFDAIVLACGVRPDCESNLLCKELLQQWPLPIQGGFPCISEDLEWTDRLFVVGGLGSLSIGPDASNLMGMRRAAHIVANSLECRCWLRESEVLKNPFDALMCYSSDEDSCDE